MTYAKKQFGQNFLKDARALEKIISAAEIVPGETILEIGPGRGALTKELLKSGAQVVAFEIDPEMVEVLHEKFPEAIESQKLVIHSGDILDTELSEFVFENHNFKVVANIPYYITGLLLRKFLESNIQPSSMVLLVQKEVAERIVDGEKQRSKRLKQGKENILSLSVKAYGDVRYVATVGAQSFSPAPRVDSAILAITNISKSYFLNHRVKESDFFAMIKQGFGQKRKTLVNNLKQGGYDSAQVTLAINSLDLDSRVRAEVLELDHWFELIKKLHGM